MATEEVQAPFIRQSVVKKAIKAAGKKAGSDFMQTLEDIVAVKVAKCIAEHNGGRKTLDAAVAKLIFGA